MSILWQELVLQKWRTRKYSEWTWPISQAFFFQVDYSKFLLHVPCRKHGRLRIKHGTFICSDWALNDLNDLNAFPLGYLFVKQICGQIPSLISLPGWSHILCGMGWNHQPVN
jgi:hypothetical protein